MKRFAPLTLAATAALVLAACSEPATVSYFETLEEQQEAEQAYLTDFNEVRNSDSHWEYFPRDNISDQEAIEQGHEACEYIVEDPDPFGLEMAEEHLKGYGHSNNAREALMTFSQEHFCVDAADEAFEKVKQSTYGY